MKTCFVTSKDSTKIGYRRLGQGPGLILIHGGMQASQNFTKLATALSDRYTVHVPDRRGRGLSGPFGDDYGIAREREDLQALVEETGAELVFGLSSGAIIVLCAALTIPALRKVALYEPPLQIGDSPHTGWVARFDEEIAKGDLASAMLTVIHGTMESSFNMIPRILVVPVLRRMIDADAKEAKGDRVPLKALIPTMHYDARLVVETANKVESFKALKSEVLLLGGNKSVAYLRAALDALSAVLPNATRVEIPGVGHLAADDSGKPELVAQELDRFFRAPTPN